MTSVSPKLTQSCRSQKFKKLHRAATKADDDDGENADSDAAATPKTPKTPATGNKTPRKRKPVKQDPDEDDSDTPVGTTPKPKKTRTVRTPRSTAKGKAALSEEMVTEDDNAGVEDKNVKLEPMGASDSDQFETPDHAGSDEDPVSSLVNQMQLDGELLIGAGILSLVKLNRIRAWRRHARNAKR